MVPLPHRNGRPTQPEPPAAPPARPDYLASVARPSSALYCVKNGLSAFLMSLLARRHAHQKQVVVSSGSVAALPRDEIYRAIEQQHCTRVHPATNLRALLERVGFWADHCLGRAVYVYHTCSFDDQVRRLSGPLFPPCTRVIVEHGTVEWFRYLDGCRAGEADARKVFLLSFHEETMRFLKRQGIEPTLRAYPFPYPNEFTWTPGPADRGRALFAVQPLVDGDILSADDCALALRRFLERRPRKMYRIKPHPRACARTMNVVTRTLEEGGYRYDVLTDNRDVLEKAFPTLGCGEACSFYSTASMLASRLYRVPFDTAIPEILRHTTVRKPIQLDLIHTVAGLFEIEA